MADRATWVRYLVAAALGLSLLGLTYALFDPDLGTPVPLLQEITCRGAMGIEMRNGLGNETIMVPQTGLIVSTRSGEEPHPSYVRLFRRDAPTDDWVEYLTNEAREGETTFFLSDTKETTEAYAEARSLDGTVCKGKTSVLRGQLTSSAPTTP